MELLTAERLSFWAYGPVCTGARGQNRRGRRTILGGPCVSAVMGSRRVRASKNGRRCAPRALAHGLGSPARRCMGGRIVKEPICTHVPYQTARPISRRRVVFWEALGRGEGARRALRVVNTPLSRTPYATLRPSTHRSANCPTYQPPDYGMDARKVFSGGDRAWQPASQARAA
jgi:hypothetical protein